MLYRSTRGHPDRKHFSDILLAGLAPDGGLYLPETYPQLDAAALAGLRRVWQDEGYAGLAFRIMSPYIDDIPEADLRAMCARAYTPEMFGSAEITPLHRLDDHLSLLGLSNGPTFAFKDMAMQFLGHLFEYELARRGEELNILGATSGDTGSAAEYAMRGKRGIRVFMTSPQGRMSAFQQAQMFSLQDENIINIAIAGSFDDCQDVVKAIAADAEFKRHYRIGAVNSINWARILAQTVYYVAGYLQQTETEGQRVSFAVPSGNFGNVCAGHVARMMGLPIDRLIVATNENDVLDEFFRSGAYRVRGADRTFVTSSPSMDISKASNLERFVFNLLGGDAERVRALFGDQVPAGGFDLGGDPRFAEAAARFGFVSGASSHADRLETIRKVFARHRRIIDPHTADAVKVAMDHTGATPIIVLETALPIKFEATIREALGHVPPRPEGLADIEALPRRVTDLPKDPEAVKALIAEVAGAAAD